MRRRLAAIARWLDARLGASSPIGELARHPIPPGSASWFYVLGAATLACFGVLVASGIVLTLFYVPSARDAWSSLDHLTYVVPLGWLLRAIHYWASNFMVALLLLHAVQVFLFGAYKYPRELTWVVGVGLLLATLANAFTGQVLRFDQDAYWGIGIGAAIAGRTPGLGAEVVHLLLGGPIIGGRTLSRFFTLHTFVVPAAIGGLVLLHLRLVLRLGVSDPPVAGQPVDPDGEGERYATLIERRGIPFFPNAAWRDLVFTGCVLLGIVAFALIFGPKGPGEAPDPTQIHTTPRPDFYFLWLFALLALLPPRVETPLMLLAPVLLVGALVAIPFVAGRGERHPGRRPVAVLGVILLFTALGVLTRMGETSPWSPVMDAWSAAATPPAYVRGRTPLELQGALLVQQKQCRNCHALGGEGGRRGPALDGVADRLSHSELVRQVLQGGGNMPAYGKRLDPTEVDALVAFLQTLGSSQDRTGRTGPGDRGAPPGSPDAPRG